MIIKGKEKYFKDSRYARFYQSNWTLIEGLWWSDEPVKTGVYCGVSYNQLRNPDYMVSIGLK